MLARLFSFVSQQGPRRNGRSKLDYPMRVGFPKNSISMIFLEASDKHQSSICLLLAVNLFLLYEQAPSSSNEE